MSNKLSLKLLVIGGCHVQGYPVGATLGFVTVMQRALEAGGVTIEIATLAPVSMKNVSTALDSNGTLRADFVILQLGNYETVELFQKAIRRFLGIKRNRPRPIAVCDPICHSPGVSVADLHVTLWTRLIMRVKYATDCLCKHSLLNFNECWRHFENAVRALAMAPGIQVITISPLPCLDWVTLDYRRRLGAAMVAICRRRGVHYMDLLSGDWEGQYLFSNHTHLSAVGHRLLGTAVAALVRQAVASRMELNK